MLTTITPALLPQPHFDFVGTEHFLLFTLKWLGLEVIHVIIKIKMRKNVSILINTMLQLTPSRI